MTASTRPTVAVVGRPNVGKSTLVNRIIGRREAIVEERPGVTRDRKEVHADWRGRDFTLVDTGGWMAQGDHLDDQVSAQAERAIREADAVLFVVDATVGVTDEDARVADIIKRAQRPTVLVANKVDSSNQDALIWELLALGVGDPLPVSALHGRGAGDLLDALVAVLPPAEPDEEVEEPDAQRVFSVAIVGRPNVGKSTLFNRLIGDERAVVHDRPGTTRDTIDTILQTPDGPLRLVDTAGMRRRAKVDDGTEYYSTLRALSAVDRSDVTLLVIDGTVGITHQDQRLAERIDAAGCPIVVLVNKWELLDAEQREAIEWAVEDKLHFVGEAPMLKISALTGRGVQRLLPALALSIADYQRRIPTAKVNNAIRRAQAEQQAPHGGRVLYATQGATDPPTFVLFANKTLPATYLRYLERKLREDLKLGSTPIKMRVKKRNE